MTSQSYKPQYPNLDNVSFLYLDIQRFHCIEDGEPVSWVWWPDAYKLPKHDERFMLAEPHLIVNWRRVTKIDFADRLIYIDDIPVWFEILEHELIEKLKKSILNVDMKAKITTFSPASANNPIPFETPLDFIRKKLCKK